MLMKKMLRTVWNYKSQFISMIIMAAIGIGVFLGFNIHWHSLRTNAFDFLMIPIMPITASIQTMDSQRKILTQFRGLLKLKPRLDI